MTTAMWRANELAVLETRPIWKRRVVLFSRSVPISILLLILVAVTALAGAFAHLRNLKVSTSSAAAATGAWTAASCTVITPPATIGFCGEDDGFGQLGITVSDLTDDSQIQMDVTFTADAGNTADVTMQPVGTPDQSYIQVTSAQEGSVVAPGGVLAVQLDIAFVGLTPGLSGDVSLTELSFDY